jgi:HMG (high mobility group) box
MTSKTKLNVLASVNSLVRDLFTAAGQPVLLEKWLSPEHQKKLGACIGLKPREVIQGPQRNISAYLFFCEDKRREILETNPGIKPNKVMILFGEKWKQLSEEERAPYIEKANSDKARYMEFLEESRLQKSASSTASVGARQSAFTTFCNENRQLVKDEFPDLDAKGVRKELNRRWKLSKSV